LVSAVKLLECPHPSTILVCLKPKSVYTTVQKEERERGRRRKDRPGNHLELEQESTIVALHPPNARANLFFHKIHLQEPKNAIGKRRGEYLIYII
jgi:hypothetical protein